MPSQRRADLIAAINALQSTVNGMDGASATRASLQAEIETLRVCCDRVGQTVRRHFEIIEAT